MAEKSNLLQRPFRIALRNLKLGSARLAPGASPEGEGDLPEP